MSIRVLSVANQTDGCKITQLLNFVVYQSRAQTQPTEKGSCDKSQNPCAEAL